MQKSNQQEITAIKTSTESHLHWKDYFHKKPLFLRIYANFDLAVEIGIFWIGEKRTKILYPSIQRLIYFV